MKVIKRDGREVPFDRGKISAAVFMAMSASGDGDGGDALQIADQVERELDGQEHSVEEIQDIVERTMMKAGFCEAAKAYCLYRDKRNHARDARSSLMKGIDEIIQSDARKNDRKRENANIDGNTPMGAMLQIGSTCARAYNELYFLRPEQAKAHREGDWHIHDFDF
ncbi:MAG: anaerobic ribonucleoside triphosphate reductase, partial [Selenomonadaceae bacterium]|nr:anaerobic ribonucleoside triphosphate reductase [Selenomonadaceae bacterium]